MEKAIKYVKELIRHNKVKQVSKTLFEVEEHSVKIQKKSGATLLLCNCINHTFNCNSPAFCVHKMAVIAYLTNKDFLERLEKLINQYESFNTNKLNVSQECFIDDLKSIKEKW
jgi:hypothetical protein